jgi:hypothetical protein
MDNATRAHHFIVANLLDLFNQVTPRCIVDFIKAIGFYPQFYILYASTNFIYLTYPASELDNFNQQSSQIDRVLALMGFLC